MRLRESMSRTEFGWSMSWGWAAWAKLSIAGWLVAIGALGCAMTVPALPAQGYTVGLPSQWSICFNDSQANLTGLEASLSPDNGATVTAGTPVIFAGHSEVSPTFAIASSSALLSSPDIDSGTGSAQVEPASSGPPVVYSYTFTSTKTTATPRTIYWEASFSDSGLAECAGLSPTTYTTSVRTLTVLPSPTEAAAARKQQEEAVAKKQEEAAAAQKKNEEETAAATGSVSVDGVTINVQDNHEAAVKLTCAGTVTCAGGLTLTVKTNGSGKGKKKHIKTQIVSSTSFSLAPDKSAAVELELNAAGRTLLEADHGRLNATLTILQSSPAPSHTQTENVQLVQQKAHGKTRK